MPDMPRPGEVTVADIVRRSPFAERTVRRWVTEGDLVPIRRGRDRRVFFSEESVEALGVQLADEAVSA